MPRFLPTTLSQAVSPVSYPVLVCCRSYFYLSLSPLCVCNSRRIQLRGYRRCLATGVGAFVCKTLYVALVAAALLVLVLLVLRYVGETLAVYRQLKRRSELMSVRDWQRRTQRLWLPQARKTMRFDDFEARLDALRKQASSERELCVTHARCLRALFVKRLLCAALDARREFRFARVGRRERPCFGSR